MWKLGFQTPRAFETLSSGSLLRTFEPGGILCWKVRSWAIQHDPNSDSCHQSIQNMAGCWPGKFNSQIFMNHVNSEEHHEMSSNKKHPQTSTFFTLSSNCSLLNSTFPQFFLCFFNSPWLNLLKRQREETRRHPSQGSAHQCHRQIWSDTSLSSRERSQDLTSQVCWSDGIFVIVTNGFEVHIYYIYITTNIYIYVYKKSKNWPDCGLMNECNSDNKISQ